MEEKDTPIYEEYEHGIDPKFKAFFAISGGFIGTIILAWFLGKPLAPVMDKIQGTRLYHFIPFVISISLFIVLTYKARIKNIRGLKFLSSAVLLHGLGEALNMINTGGGQLFDRGSNYVAAVADLLFPIAVIFLYLHVELVQKLRPGLVNAIGIIGTATPLIIGGTLLIILQPLNADTLVENIRSVVLIYLGLFALVILWIALFGLKTMYGTLSHADSPDVSNGSLLVLMGFSSLITNFLLLGVDYTSGISDKPLLFQGSEFTIHNTWLVTFALLVLFLAYVLNPEFTYSVPFDVYQLLVINSEYGVTLFSFVNEFRREGDLTHSALKSATIVAIQTLVQEIAHAEGHIILIGMSDRILILKSRNQIVSVLISEKNSYFINKGLEDFTDRFYEEFENHIVNFTGNVSVFKGATHLIRKHLPFMRKESLLETITTNETS